MDLQITPRRLSGSVTPPPSKSMAHRLIIAAALGSGISTVANWIATYILNNVFHWGYWLTSIVTFAVGMIFTFVANRKFTFRSANNVPVAMAKALAFYAVFTPLSTWGGDALVAIGWNEYVVLIGTMLLNFVLEFLYDRFVVFGASIDTAVKK